MRRGQEGGDPGESGGLPACMRPGEAPRGMRDARGCTVQGVSSLTSSTLDVALTVAEDEQATADQVASFAEFEADLQLAKAADQWMDANPLHVGAGGAAGGSVHV